MLRGRPLLFREKRSFFSRFIFVRCGVTLLWKKRFVACDLVRNTYIIQPILLRYVFGFKNTYCIRNSAFISISRFPCLSMIAWKITSFTERDGSKKSIKKIFHADWRTLIFTHFQIFSTSNYLLTITTFFHHRSGCF